MPHASFLFNYQNMSNLLSFAGLLNFLIVNHRNDDLKMVLSNNEKKIREFQSHPACNQLSLSIDKFNIEALEILLENNFEVGTSEDEDWANPMVKAMRLKNKQMISLLLQHGYRHTCKDCKENGWMETCMMMEYMKKKDILMMRMLISKLSSEEISSSFCRYMHSENMDKDFAYEILTIILECGKQVDLKWNGINKFSSWFDDTSHVRNICIEMEKYIFESRSILTI